MVVEIRQLEKIAQSGPLSQIRSHVYFLTAVHLLNLSITVKCTYVCTRELLSGELQCVGQVPGSSGVIHTKHVHSSTGGRDGTGNEVRQEIRPIVAVPGRFSLTYFVIPMYL